jgi:hypothetical protein
MIPLNRIADLRHIDAPICVDSRATQAATSLCVTAASGTRSHVGQIQVFSIDRYDSRVVAFSEGAFAVNHCRDQSPTVTRARAGSVHSPRAIAKEIPASQRSASTRRSKVLERSRPSGPRYLAPTSSPLFDETAHVTTRRGRGSACVSIHASTSFCSIQPDFVTSKRSPSKSVDTHSPPIEACCCQNPEGTWATSAVASTDPFRGKGSNSQPDRLELAGGAHRPVIDAAGIGVDSVEEPPVARDPRLAAPSCRRPRYRAAHHKACVPPPRRPAAPGGRRVRGDVARLIHVDLFLALAVVHAG